ncbi:MAG: nuclear transport factor 2 family protein [Pyrinomonadaceae bacterium]
MKKFTIAALLLFSLTLNVVAQDQIASVDQGAMVATERAFAKLGFERGVRESFIKYFADDAIAFTPHPEKVRAGFLKQEPETFPLPVTLNWAPVWGDISAAGDMGYNTGPVVYEDTGENKRPTRNGIFFSVWKKQADGSWLVVLDLGAGVPTAVAPLTASYLSATTTLPKKQKLNAKDELAKMLKAEGELMAASAKGTISATWGKWLSADARVHRPRTMPALGAEAVKTWLATQTFSYSGRTMFSDIAASGELGYTYGSFETGAPNGLKGYYARVWKRDGNGKWRVVVDILSPLPPAQNKLA